MSEDPKVVQFQDPKRLIAEDKPPQTTQLSAPWEVLKPLRPHELYAGYENMELKWLWQDYIPEESLTIFAGYMKDGKSTFLYSLLGAMMAGRPFLGRTTQQTPVMVLALEEHPREVCRHLLDAGVAPNAELFTYVGPYPPSDRNYQLLRQRVQENGIKLLVIDTLSRFWKIENENDNAEAIRKLGPVLDMAREFKFSVMPIHHLGKGAHGAGGETDPLKQLRGGSAIGGMADQILLLSRKSGGSETTRLLRSRGRYADTPSELLIDWSKEACDYTVIDNVPTAVAKEREREERLLAALEEEPGLSRTALVGRLKTNPNRAYAIIKRLIEAGKIADGEGGKLTLTQLSPPSR